MNLRRWKSLDSPLSNDRPVYSPHRWLIPLFTLLSSFLPSLLVAQAQSTPSRKDFKLILHVNLVGVLVTVTTPEGNAVSNLKQEDFQVYENGNLQEVAIFGKEADQPLRLCLLFDMLAGV